MRARIAAIGSLTLVVGFAVAQLTGARWLGGVVLVIGALLAGVLGWRFAGPARTVAAVAVFVVAFVVSHPLGRIIGAWPSVIAVAVVAGGVGYLLLRPVPSRPPRDDVGQPEETTAGIRDRPTE